MGRFVENFTGFTPGSLSRADFTTMAARSIVPLLALVVTPGCAIHPVQQDVTHVPPVAIIHHIRCETRLAIQDKAIELLRGYNGGNDPRALLLADRLNGWRGKWWPVNPNTDLPGAEARKFYNRYIQTGIAYDFTLDITEDNKVTLLADPIRLITNGTAGIGLNGSGELNRENARRFIMSDTFDKLLRDQSLDCVDGSPNFAYPIAGSIGIGELISTFIDLNEDQNLQSLDTGNSQVFADTLTFTTTFSGSVGPHVEIAPFGNNWGLASPTNFTAFGQRLDKHMLIIGLSMSAPKPAGPAAPLLGGAAQTRSALQKSSTTPTEQSALDAARQARIDAYLDRAAH